MKIIGTLPGRPWCFTSLIQSIANREDEQLRCLLKTSFITGYLTEIPIVTKMTKEEKAAVSKMHYETLLSDSLYKDAKAYNLPSLMPELVGPKIQKARFGGGDEKNKLVRLEFGTFYAYVEDYIFASALQRHKNTEWRFTPGTEEKPYWKSPIIGISMDGFFAGNIVCMIATIPIFPPKAMRRMSPSLAKRKKVTQSDGIYYRPV